MATTQTQSDNLVSGFHLPDLEHAFVRQTEVTFTETAGAGTYTGSVVLPAGSTVHDIIIHGTALWDNAGAVTLKVGDAADDDAYYTAVNLKATDLLAGEALSFDSPGGKQGVDIIQTMVEGVPNTTASWQIRRRYLSTERTISGVITTAGAGGSAGRTRMIVVWSAPASVRSVKAATKV